jgi:hypothetical protein
MKPGGSNHSLTLRIHDDKGPAGFHCFSEEEFEYVFLVPIALRMLFPDERIRRDGKKIVPIVSRERAKLDKLTF